MKLIFAFLLAILGFLGPALAQAPQPSAQAQQASPPSADTIAAAAELLSVMSNDVVAQMANQMLSQMWPMIESQVSNQVSAEGLKEIQNVTERTMVAFTQKSMAAWPAIYANHFTAAELREMVAFYKTPTGIKTIAMMPQMTAEFYATLGPKMPDLENDLRGAIPEVMAKYPK